MYCITTHILRNSKNGNNIYSQQNPMKIMYNSLKKCCCMQNTPWEILEVGMYDKLNLL